MKAAGARRWLRRLATSRGTMALTLSQLFMGAITIGIASFRGTEAYESFYYETQVGHANYGASKLGNDHARAANTVASNNVISSAIMGPRFAVEADNITMLVNAMIACPQASFNPHMATICAEFHANYWRMLAKLAWVRVQQKMVWGSLGKLSDSIDGITSIRALEQVQSTIKPIDSDVRVRFEDPSTSGSIWGTSSFPTACTLSQKDTLLSPMPGAAFPVLMENLLAGLPMALVHSLPQAICGALEDMQPGSKVRLPQIPSVAKKTSEDCNALEQQMESQVLAGGGSSPTFSTDVGKFVTCGVQSPTSPGRSQYGPAFVRRTHRGQLSTCSFDWQKCEDDRLAENTGDYLESIGLPKLPDLSTLGGTTHAPSDPDWNHSDTMRACAFASKDVNPAVVSLNDAVRKIVSFGSAGRSATLRESHEYGSCGKWYFPDGTGEFASVAHTQQPFTAAWKYALVAGRINGGLNLGGGR